MTDGIDRAREELRKARDTRGKRQEQLGQRAATRKAIEEAAGSARHFTHDGTREEFAAKWAPFWISAAEVVRTHCKIEIIDDLNLPDGPGFQLARQLFNAALSGQDPEAFAADLREILDELRPAEGDEPPWTESPTALREFFKYLQDYALKRAGVAPEPRGSGGGGPERDAIPPKVTIEEAKEIRENQGSDEVKAQRVMSTLDAVRRHGDEWILRSELQAFGIPPTTIDRASLFEGGQASEGVRRVQREKLERYLIKRWRPKSD